MSFKPPVGVSGWDLPHLKIGAMASRIIQDGHSGFEMCWQMGSCSSGCGRGQLEVLETGCGWPAGVLAVRCVWCGCGILEAGVQSVGLGSQW